MSKEFYFDFKKVAESNTVEGVVDFDKVTDTYNEQYKQYYAKEVVRIADEQKVTWETDLYKGLGIESVKDKDSLDLYVKQLGGSANEQTEQIEKYKAAITQFESEHKDLLSYKTKATQYERKSVFANDGLTDSLLQDGLLAKFSNSEDWQEDYTAWKASEDGAKYLTPQKNTLISTGVKNNNQHTNKVSAVEQILKDKGLL